MNHLRNFLDGFAQAINWGVPQRAYLVPRGGGATNDFARISSDMRQVGADLRKVAERELNQYVCR